MKNVYFFFTAFYTTLSCSEIIHGNRGIEKPYRAESDNYIGVYVHYRIYMNPVRVIPTRLAYRTFANHCFAAVRSWTGPALLYRDYCRLGRYEIWYCDSVFHWYLFSHGWITYVILVLVYIVHVHRLCRGTADRLKVAILSRAPIAPNTNVGVGNAS